MQAYKAYYDEGKFIPVEPVKIPKGSQAIVTVLDLPIKKVQESEETSEEKIQSRLECLNELKIMITESMQEDAEMREEWLNRLKQARKLTKNEPLLDIPSRQPVGIPHELID